MNGELAFRLLLILVGAAFGAGGWVAQSEADAARGRDRDKALAGAFVCYVAAVLFVLAAVKL